LLLCAYEKNRPAPKNDFSQGLACLVELRYGFLKVQNVDAIPLPEYEALHFGIPPSGLVAEMNTGFEKRLNCHIGQAFDSSS
jgi:hypothetical protein